ncbi:MAG: site-specific recombinase for integration and excision [Symbiobacteriaceae bacterium]|nr:site-specific recombinase for integration and excision [Symbiobacteriaceae bacterium]
MYARIYTRVSTEEQATSGFSLGAQKERLEAFCVSQGWEIAGRYIDEGVSAKDLNRPEFQRMMDEVDKGDVILVYKLDRLTRSVRDLDDLLREFDTRGVLFRSVTEQFDTTTATGRLFIRMVAEMAQWERETIAERSAFGKQKKAASGEWGGGTVPLGYMGVPSERTKAGRSLLKLVPDPERAHFIPLIFEKYLSGLGIRGVALWLNNELGARTPQGCKFHAITVRRILTNPIYCGDVESGRRRRGRPKVRVQGTHEPLISREMFERVQEMFEIHKTYAPRQATGRFPLSGVARCGICGGRVDGNLRSENKENRLYKCHNYALGTGCAPAGQRSLASVSARLAEENLIREIERLHQDPSSLERLLADFAAEAATRTGLTQAERKRMEQDLAEAEGALDRWKRLFEKGHIEDEEYLAEVKPHRQRIKQLKERLAEYDAQAVEVPSLSDLGAFAINFRESWEALEMPEQKALLQQFVRAFRVQILLFPDRRVELRPAL